MRLRQNKRKICEDAIEKDDKHRDAGQTRRKSAPSRQAASAAAYAGPSPAKKPRTNRPRVAGSKLPHFLLDENGDQKSKAAGDNSQPEDGSDEYEFNNVVKAVALTLAEASQNDSETPCKESTLQNGDVQNEAKEGSGEEVSGEAEAGTDSAKRKRKEKDTAAEATSPVDTRKTNRRPPSKRIKMLREAEEIRAEEARNAERDLGAVEDSRPHKSRVMPQRSKKRIRQLFSGDENSGLDTLATLADLSLSGMEFPDAGTKGDGVPEQQLQELVSQVLSSVKKEQDKTDEKSSPEVKKRRRRAIDKLLGEACPSGKQETIVYKPNGRPKRVPSKNFSKRNEDFEHDMDRIDRMEESASNHGESLENGPKTRAKKRSVNEKASESRSKTETRCPHTSAEFGPSSAQVRLQHMMSRPEVRQWCMYEWLYSAIDLPWFARNEFVEYVAHAGLGPVSKLTRTEWGWVRGALGKPRRFSDKFVLEERAKLDEYRERVRSQYQEMRSGSGAKEALPPDLARPLAVGQRVTARHPKTKGLHDGNVLTVDRNKCRVQFVRQDLGVEFVLDIDAMPADPVENMSELMRKRRIIDFSGTRVNSGAARAALNDRLDRSGPGYFIPSSHFLSTLGRQAQMDTIESVSLAKAATSEAAAAVQRSCPQTSAHAKEELVFCLAELNRQLDKKQALVVELHRMNDETVKPDESGRPYGEDVGFQRQYATVVLQLEKVNKQLTATMTQLRQFNTYQENQVPPWHSPSAGSQDAPCSGLSAGSPAEEITLTTRKDARSMVSAAVQAICCIQAGEDDTSKQGKVLNGHQPGGLGSNANHQHAEQLNNADQGDALQSAGTANDQVLAPDATFSNQMEAFIPIDLVASCVATLLMIQTCTEKPLPPSDVAVMLENLMGSIRPRSATNFHLYKEIEQCFDVLKNQVTAQVSIHPNATLPVDCHLR